MRARWAIAGVFAACTAGEGGGGSFGDGAGTAVADDGGSTAADGGPAGDDGDDDDDGGSESGGTGPVASTSGDGSDDAGDDTTTGEPPYACDVEPASSPVIAGEVLLDPGQPHPGDTLTVIVRSTNGTSRTDAPPMSLSVEHGGGSSMLDPATIEGGDALYYYAIPEVALGDVCLRGFIDGALEVSHRVTVTPRPPGPPVDPGGIYKITANHMWTCAEQPNNGNEVHVWVRDETGAPIDGAVVTVGMADSTDPETIYNDDGNIPTQIVTGGDGHGMLFNYWPISEHGLLVLELSVAGAASDIATELTTGWWEDDLMGCNYCGTATINVWGHWSYTVEFQRDPAATEVCVVENDHAGMLACGEPRHIHHDPVVRACWAP